MKSNTYGHFHKDVTFLVVIILKSYSKIDVYILFQLF